MRDRGQLVAAILVAVGVVLGGLYLEREVGARPLEPAPPGRAPTGGWFCPHGGGQEWEARLELANPGAEPVLVRLRGLSAARPSDVEELEVPAGTTVEVPVDARSREASTTVEYFEGFVAAGWVVHAGGEETGVAAEPCLPDTGGTWYLPDGSTLEQNDDYVLVMNPYATDAAISLTLYTERREPIRLEDWTNVVLKPFRSRAFRLNQKALGETTVSTLVEVSTGRVAAATLGVSRTGGIRSAIGLMDAAGEQILPGGADSGRSDLVVMSTGFERVGLSGSILDGEAEQPIAGLSDSSPAAESARTVTTTTATPSTLVVAADAPGVAFARRTYGVGSDEASTTGAAGPGAAWIVLPAVAGPPAHPGIVLTNTGDEPTVVTLRPMPSGDVTAPAPITVEVPARSTVSAPKGFVEAIGRSAVVALAESGTFVPAAASSSLGREGYAAYAVAVGVPVPDAWLPMLEAMASS